MLIFNRIEDFKRIDIDIDIREKAMKRENIQIRDPFVLPVKDEMRYYLYGTTDSDPWKAPGIGFDAYISENLEEWEGPYPVLGLSLIFGQAIISGRRKSTSMENPTICLQVSSHLAMSGQRKFSAQLLLLVHLYNIQMSR